MNYSLSIRLAAEELRAIEYDEFDDTYSAIGTPFENPIRMLNVQNLTDATMVFSLDGATDHFILPSFGFLFIDITSNKTRDSGWFIAQESSIYVRDLLNSATTGFVYVSAFYGKN